MNDDQYSKDGAVLLAALLPIVLIVAGIGLIVLWLVK